MNKIIASIALVMTACSCAPPDDNSPLTHAVYDAIKAEWSDDIDPRCRLTHVNVSYPDDAAFEAACHRPANELYGCAVIMRRGVRKYPAIIVSSNWNETKAPLGMLLAHEYIHLFESCSPAIGDDPEHSEPGVWSVSWIEPVMPDHDDDSLQARVLRRLDEGGWL